MDQGTKKSDQQIIRKYVRNLSPFGRKVMNSLMTLKNERKNNNFKPIINTPCSRYQNKKNIGCNDFLSSNDVNIENKVMNTTLINVQHRYGLPPISTSTDLLKAACNDDVGALAENIDKNVPSSKNSIAFQQFYSNNEVVLHQKGSNEIPKEISWNDMFDKEIFEDEENEKNFNEVYTKPFPLNTNSVFKIVDNNKCLSKQEHITNIYKDNANGKRKSKANADLHLKKPNTNISNKNNEMKSFYKENYNTTVKNWLNDMHTPNNPQETSIDNQQNVAIVNIGTFEQQKINTREVKKTALKQKKSKRIIQAQLANRDGIMKYRKPETFVESMLNAEHGVGTSANGSDNISKTLRQVKDKKLKTNFVAPIKSQTPIKEITYQVKIINSLNFATVIRDFENIEGAEGVITLLYSNGFCQLNGQHSDASGAPAGIMIGFKDTFYYLEEQVDGITDFLCRILSTHIFVSFDAKSIQLYLLCRYKVSPNSVHIIDAKIGASLLSPDKPPENFFELQQLLALRPQFTIATECVLQKAAWYSSLLRECSAELQRSLAERGLWKVFADIEMRILPITTAMQYRGISVDVGELKWMDDALLARMKKIEARCHAAAGRRFQINSAAQVRALVYDELQLDAAADVRVRQTICKRAKSTSEATLRSLIAVHPLPKLILEYRHLHKAHATFVAGIAQHVQAGVVKPTWVQTAAATGRIACNNPNLQAIPKMPSNLVLFPEGGDSDEASVNFRCAYVARAGYALLGADFKHIECRVFAHAARDADLLAALASPDLFRVLAAKWLNKSEVEVSSADRERTKRIVYASLYGAGARKLMEILDVGYEQALSIMTSFNRTFPSLKNFRRSVVSALAQCGGRLASASGRARTFSDIGSADYAARAHAERQAVNFIIQGTAADLCKIAMIQTEERLRQAAPPVEAHLLLQIHDELVWEVLHQHLARASVIIKDAMESSGQALGMPRALPVALYRGSKWSQMEQFQPDTMEC